MPCSAMQCHAMPATMHLEFLGPEIWSRPFWFWHWIKLTLTGRLITLVLRVQKAGLFIWSTKFRYVNSGILLECCRIASNCHCFAVGGARPEAKEMYSAVLISWNSLALWGCDLIYIWGFFGRHWDKHGHSKHMVQTGPSRPNQTQGEAPSTYKAGLSIPFTSINYDNKW